MWGDFHADGVGILLKGWEFPIQAELEVVPGRVLCVDASWRGSPLRLVSVYAPSPLGERRDFFQSLEPLMFTNRIVVLGGDFNKDLDKVPISGLGNLVRAFALLDAHRPAGIQQGTPEGQPRVWTTSFVRGR